MSLLEQFTDAKSNQPKATDSGARQVNGSYKLDEIGEERIAEAIAEYGLEPRPDVVAKVNGMAGDWQAPKGGKGVSVYATGTVSTRGFTL